MMIPAVGITDRSAVPYVNVKDQYYPTGRVSHSQFVEIDRRITASEPRNALEAARAAGLWRVHRR